MKKTNETYCIVFKGKNITERYYRDKDGWLKISSRGRVFRATAEQVLNHLLPALAFSDELRLAVTVEHYEKPYWQTLEVEKNARILLLSKYTVEKPPFWRLFDIIKSCISSK